MSPSRPGRVCGQPGCGVIVQGGYCAEHKRDKDTKTDEERAFYNSRRWRNYRLGYLQRHPLCLSCKAKNVITAAKVVDHIVAMRDGGDLWDPANHQGQCGSCHQRKRQAEGQARAGQGR